ncbi:MAG: hypothetical protein CL521_05505 [Actinobacteria bacterium]|nr:hypothetical protein [Actinomycetota bacterium]
MSLKTYYFEGQYLTALEEGLACYDLQKCRPYASRFFGTYSMLILSKAYQHGTQFTNSDAGIIYLRSLLGLVDQMEMLGLFVPNGYRDQLTRQIDDQIHRYVMAQWRYLFTAQEQRRYRRALAAAERILLYHPADEKAVYYQSLFKQKSMISVSILPLQVVHSDLGRLDWSDVVDADPSDRILMGGVQVMDWVAQDMAHYLDRHHSSYFNLSYAQLGQGAPGALMVLIGISLQIEDLGDQAQMTNVEDLLIDSAYGGLIGDLGPQYARVFYYNQYQIQYQVSAQARLFVLDSGMRVIDTQILQERASDQSTYRDEAQVLGLQADLSEFPLAYQRLDTQPTALDKDRVLRDVIRRLGDDLGQLILQRLDHEGVVYLD